VRKRETVVEKKEQIKKINHVISEATAETADQELESKVGTRARAETKGGQKNPRAKTEAARAPRQRGWLVLGSLQKFSTKNRIGLDRNSGGDKSVKAAKGSRPPRNKRAVR